MEALQKEKQQYLDMINKYREEVGAGISKTFIDGNRIKEILLETAPELVNSNAFFNVKGKMVHHLAFAVNKLFEAQWERNVSTVEEAEAFIRYNAKNWQNHWKQQQRKQSSNWFKQIKKADASSVPTDIGLPEVLEKDDNISFRQDGAISPFQRGDRVRLRKGGWGSTQVEGYVKDIGENSMLVIIETGKHAGNEVTVDLLDAARLSMTWEKI